MNILEEIAKKTKARIEDEKENVPLEKLKEEACAAGAGTNRPFEAAIRSEGLSFICECKKASPSKGVIEENFSCAEIAKDYEKGGAAAVSILTEPFYFLGSDKYLKDARAKIGIPILRKDFTVDEYMIYQAKIMGADALLLICAILDDERLGLFLELCEKLGLSALVEAHDETEIGRAVSAGAKIIGVNNRDLKTFSVDIENSLRLRDLVPPKIAFVSESGISTKDDVRRLADAGVDAVLIGETVMRAGDGRVEALRGLVEASAGRGV